ncbi:nucleoside hydrolase [Companilactobacillus baiquanensis]|uniref:Nucleoside hydrolase n=1 Tax=Companilactobacillus baiquanensis TaxID=2486005 RepID=A0ABW1UYH6_9LACO|nr:nucleoside hydrolase [Companilactobacillus baiquanensis]
MENIILDCDPGHDDAIAMIMAIASSKINVLAVTTSAGNQPYRQTLRNAMSLLTLMKKRDIPVAYGNRKPLVRDLIPGITMHGITGLDGAELPNPDFSPRKENAVELMNSIISDHPRNITLVVTGPCTNVALLLSVHPEIKSLIKKIVILGGGMGVGNIGLTEEFNMAVDPEAAKIVMESGIPITLAPLNVGFEAQLLDSDIENISKIKNNDVAKAVTGLISTYRLSFDLISRDFEGVPLYDPCTIAWLIDPEKFSSRFCNVEIETKGELTTGETVIDYYNVSKRKPNAEVLFHINQKWFANLIIESIKKFQLQ